MMELRRKKSKSVSISKSSPTEQNQHNPYSPNIEEVRSGEVSFKKHSMNLGSQTQFNLLSNQTSISSFKKRTKTPISHSSLNKHSLKSNSRFIAPNQDKNSEFSCNTINEESRL